MVRHRSQPSSVLRGLKARELRGLAPRSVLPADEATEWAGGGERVSSCSERPRRTSKVLDWLVPVALVVAAAVAEGKACERTSLADLRVKVASTLLGRDRRSEAPVEVESDARAPWSRLMAVTMVVAVMAGEV